MDKDKCLWMFLFCKQYIGCNCTFVVDFDERKPRVFMKCLERYDATSLERDMMIHSASLYLQMPCLFMLQIITEIAH